MQLSRTVFLSAIIFTLFHCCLLLLLPVLPFTDLPNHLAEAAVYKDQGTGSLLDQYYASVPGFYPNTFHTVFCSLFPSVEFGNKVYYLLFVIGMIAAVYLILKKLGGHMAMTMLAFLYLYNYNTTWGFSGFTISITGILFLFLFILRYQEKPSLLNLLYISLLLVLIFLMHAQIGLFGILLFGSLLLYRHWNQWGLLFTRVLMGCLPVALLVLIWWNHRAAEVQEESTLGFLGAYYSGRYLGELKQRLLLPVFDHYFIMEAWKGKVVGLLFSLLVVLPFILYRGWKRVPAERLRHMPFASTLIFFALCLMCYLILPTELPGQGIIYERFSVFVFLSFILLTGVLLREVSVKSLSWLTIFSAAIYTGLWTDYYVSFHRQTRSFESSLFEGLDPKGIMVGLIYENSFRGRPVYFHFPNYFLVRRGGLTATKMIDYRFGVVRRREPKGAEIPVYEEWVSGSDYKVPSNYGGVTYFLVHGKAPIQPDANLAGARLVKDAGVWTIWSKAPAAQ